MPSFRHPFKASLHDPGRCAYCLSSLDCAPHLPIAPGLETLAQALERHRDTPKHGPRRTARRYAELRRAAAAVQGER